MLRLTASSAIEAQTELGEGPILFPDGAIRWVDLLEGEVYSLRGGRNALVAKFSHEVSKVLPWRHGMLVLGRERIIALDTNNQLLGSLLLHSTESNLRCSDAVVLPDGSIAVGILDRDLAPAAGRLVQITLDWRVRELISGTTISNGIALHPTESYVLWLDSAKQKLYRMDWLPQEATLASPAEFAAVPEELGVPDGICFDAEGGCWVALWGGGAVVRFDGSGRIDCRVDVAAANTTSVAFDSANNLVITSAAVTLNSNERARNPGAGGIWMVPAMAHGRAGIVSKVALQEIPRGEIVAD